ncbi:hypothetical protein [Falsiroseomonas sp. E2-1-a20]|uniref:hypothetical protein n=1 Tax=Falsiroseomonas sp. E2-1-a20 TaxID=3239300 RepID=UPI003F3B9C89
MSEPPRNTAGTPDETSTTDQPRLPADAETPRIGALVVISPAAVAQFVPPGPGTTMPASSEPDEGIVFVAHLPLGPVRDVTVRHFDHTRLRIAGAAATRLVVLTSDGPAVAAALGVPDTTVHLTEDGGTVTAVARVAAAIGLAPQHAWPEDETGRLAILLRLLHASGHHPDAPARLARLGAYMLAINSEQVPVPLTDDELIRIGRVAGFGAEALDPGFALGDAWPAHLSTEERAAMPDEGAVHALFREAAKALARVAPSRPGAPEPTKDGAT